MAKVTKLPTSTDRPRSALDHYDEALWRFQPQKRDSITGEERDGPYVHIHFEGELHESVDGCFGFHPLLVVSDIHPDEMDAEDFAEALKLPLQWFIETEIKNLAALDQAADGLIGTFNGQWHPEHRNHFIDNVCTVLEQTIKNIQSWKYQEHSGETHE